MFKAIIFTMTIVISSYIPERQITNSANLVTYQIKKPIVANKWNPEHLSKLKEGKDIWNKWRVKYPDIRPNLAGANLEDANLQDYNLSKVNLIGANLRGANLRNSKLWRANLTNAKLNAADLSGTDFWEAILKNVDYRNAKLPDWTITDDH